MISQPMTPYVIDQSKRKEYFLFLVFFTLTSFFLGYFFGYQSGHSDGVISAATPSSEWVQPSKKLISDNKEIKKPEAKDVSKKADKSSKKPDKKKNNTKTVSQKPLKKKSDKKPAAVKKTSASSNSLKTQKKKPESKPKPVRQEKVSQKSQKTAASISKKREEKIVKSLSSAVPEIAKDPNKTQLSAVEKETLKKESVAVKDNSLLAKDGNKELKSYSVQVGMFLSKPNAEKFINTLKTSGFEVYLSHITSSNGQEKYNVRLGPYAVRNSADASMKLYKQSYSTPAYIVINK